MVSGTRCPCLPVKGVAMRFAGNLDGFACSGLGACGCNGLGDIDSDVALIPVSSRAAVRNAILLFQGNQNANRLDGLGTSEQAQGAAQGAAAGAKAGSIIPVVGTVIGAVIGAIAGWALTKKKPVRPTAEQKQACQAEVSEYMQYASEMGAAPLPLDEAALKHLNWCYMALYGADIKNLDPRYFDGNFVDLMNIAKDIVRKIYATKVGDTVQIVGTTNKIRGQTFKSAGLTFVNPTFTNLRDFTQRTFGPMAIEYCTQTAGKGSGGCGNLYQRPEFQRLLYDMIACAARQVLPNISEADLRASSEIATEIGTSAKDVVSAVETIIGRSVQREETAALLALAPTNVVKDIAREISTTSTAPPIIDQTPEQLVTTNPLTTDRAVSVVGRNVFDDAKKEFQDIVKTLPQPITAGISGDWKTVLPFVGIALALAFKYSGNKTSRRKRR